MKSHRNRTLYRLRRGWINEIVKCSRKIDENFSKFLAARDNNFIDYPTLEAKTNFVSQNLASIRLLARKMVVYIKMLS